MYIREWLFGVLFFPLVMGCQNMSQITEEVVVNLRQKGTDISSSMYGVFFEEINHAGDGGLYAELVQNRSFEEDEIPEGYRIEGTKLIPLAKPYHLTGEIRERSFEWYGGKIRGVEFENRRFVRGFHAFDKRTSYVSYGSEQFGIVYSENNRCCTVG